MTKTCTLIIDADSQSAATEQLNCLFGKLNCDGCNDGDVKMNCRRCDRGGLQSKGYNMPNTTCKELYGEAFLLEKYLEMGYESAYPVTIYKSETPDFHIHDKHGAFGLEVTSTMSEYLMKNLARRDKLGLKPPYSMPPTNRKECWCEIQQMVDEQRKHGKTKLGGPPVPGMSDVDKLSRCVEARVVEKMGKEYGGAGSTLVLITVESTQAGTRAALQNFFDTRVRLESLFDSWGKIAVREMQNQCTNSKSRMSEVLFLCCDVMLRVVEDGSTLASSTMIGKQVGMCDTKEFLQKFF